MFDTLTFERVTAGRSSADLKLFRLSSCAFCEQAQRFLAEHDLSYERIVFDLLSLDVRRKIRNEFQRELGMSLRFPALVIDGSDVLLGFDRREWERSILEGADQ